MPFFAAVFIFALALAIKTGVAVLVYYAVAWLLCDLAGLTSVVSSTGWMLGEIIALCTAILIWLGVGVSTGSSD